MSWSRAPSRTESPITCGPEARAGETPHDGVEMLVDITSEMQVTRTICNKGRWECRWGKSNIDTMLRMPQAQTQRAVNFGEVAGIPGTPDVSAVTRTV